MTGVRKTQTDCRQCPLRRLEAFVPIGAEQLHFLEKFKIGEMEVEPGATVLAEANETPHIFTVLDGMLYRHRSLDSGERQIMSFLMPGDLCGLQLALLNDIQHSVTALTRARLCVFQRSRFWSLFEANAEFAYQITWASAVQETILDSTIVSLGLRSAKQRIAHLFVHLYEHGAQVGLARNGVLRAPLKNWHLSEALGVTRVHVSRVLNELMKAGLVERHGGDWRLPGLNELKAIARSEGFAVEPRPLL